MDYHNWKRSVLSQKLLLQSEYSRVHKNESKVLHSTEVIKILNIPPSNTFTNSFFNVLVQFKTLLLTPLMPNLIESSSNLEICCILSNIHA